MGIRESLLSLAQPIEQFKVHPKNVRQGDIGAISESLKAHGQYRPIVVQRGTNHILAGNHTYQAAKALGWKEIAVTYVDCDNDQAVRILLADNRTNDLASYDDTALVELLKELNSTELGLSDTAYSANDLDDLVRTFDYDSASNDSVTYSQATKIPQYEIVGDKPATHELFDATKATQLMEAVRRTEMPDDVRDFLLTAASRHIVFNYAKIAEFYPHMPAEVQRLMEQSVLVIIDVEDAIANGFASFAKTIADLRDSEDEE